MTIKPMSAEEIFEEFNKFKTHLFPKDLVFQATTKVEERYLHSNPVIGFYESVLKEGSIDSREVTVVLDRITQSEFIERFLRSSLASFLVYATKEAKPMVHGLNTNFHTNFPETARIQGKLEGYNQSLREYNSALINLAEQTYGNSK